MESLLQAEMFARPGVDTFTFRAGQAEGVRQIASAFERGAKTVFLDAPVGSGKSLINLLAARELHGAYISTPQVIRGNHTDLTPRRAQNSQGLLKRSTGGATTPARTSRRSRWRRAAGPMRPRREPLARILRAGPRNAPISRSAHTIRPRASRKLITRQSRQWHTCSSESGLDLATRAPGLAREASPGDR